MHSENIVTWFRENIWAATQHRPTSDGGSTEMRPAAKLDRGAKNEFHPGAASRRISSD
jgi:hypothetical protein